MDPQSTALAPAISVQAVSQRLGEIDFTLEFVARSEKKKKPFLPIWDEVESNYLVIPYGMAGPNLTHTRGGYGVPMGPNERRRSRLKDPETHQIVETITSQALGLLLGQREYLTAIPANRDDYDKARLVAMLLMAMLKQPGVWRTHYQLVKEAFWMGTAIIEVGWETRSRKQFVRGTKGLQPEDVIYRDRPLQRIVALRDFCPDPSGTSIQEDMMGCAKYFEITAQQALELAEPDEDGNAVYDMADVKEAITLKQTEIAEREKRFKTGERALPDRLLPLQGIEYWGFSPIPASDGMSNRVITLLNGVRVRSRGNSYEDGNIPFKEMVVNPIAGRFYGLGPAEVVRFLQDSADNLLMVLNDAVDLAIRGPLLIGATFGGNPDQLRERMLGDIVNCTDVKQVGLVPTDYNVLQLGALHLLRGKQSMREASGSPDPVQAVGSGEGGGKAKTATEISELVRFASQRVEPMALLIEQDFYPWLGKALHSRAKQFGPPGGFVAALNGETFDVSLEDIDIEADVFFSGTRQSGSKFQRSVQYRAMGDLIGSEKGKMLALLAPEILVRMFRDGADIVDAEDIVEKMIDRALAMQKMELMMGAAKGGSVPQERLQNPEDFGTQAGETEQGGQALA